MGLQLQVGEPVTQPRPLLLAAAGEEPRGPGSYQPSGWSPSLSVTPEKTNFGTRRRIEIFQKSKMIRIENPKLLAWFQTPQTVSRPSRPNFQPHRTVEHTSQKLVSLQPPFTLKPRPKGAKKISGLVPDTSYRFQTVQTQFPASQNC